MGFIQRTNTTLLPAMTLQEIERLAPSVFATQAHCDVSDKYRFIPTIEMLDTLMSKGWEVVQAGEHRVRDASKKGFQKHMLRLRHPSLPMMGDSEFNALLFNSHDRTTGMIFRGGAFRAVCANGLVTGDDIIEPIRVKHIGYRADNVIDASYRMLDKVPLLTDRINTFRSIELTSEEKGYFAQAALIAKYGKDEKGMCPSPISPVKALAARRTADDKPDLWTTYNVIQENLVKGGQVQYTRDARGYRVGKKTTRGVNSISESTKLNAALWDLTENMAKLKGAIAA